VVSELQLTAGQRERIRTIEEEALLDRMRHPRPGKATAAKGKSADDRILAVLSAEQVRRWRTMTGAPLKSAMAPFPSSAVSGREGPPR
jgi:hypothetical protein